MAIQTTGVNNYLSRAGAFNPALDWTRSRWVLIGPGMNGGTFWNYGDPVFANPYIGIFDGDPTLGCVLEVFDGSVYHDTPVFMFPRNTWLYLAVTYKASTTTLTFSYGTLGAGMTTLGMLVVNLSAVTFIQTSELLNGDSQDLGKSANAVHLDRTWQATLTAAQLNTERLSSLPVLTTNLLADTPVPFKGNLFDTTATGAAWTLTGTSVGVQGPLPPSLQAKLLTFASRSGAGTQALTGIADLGGNSFRPMLFLPFGSDQLAAGFTDAGNPNVPCGSMMWGWDDTITHVCAVGGYQDANNFSGGVYPENDTATSDLVSLIRLQNFAFNRDQGRGYFSAAAIGGATVTWTVGPTVGYLFHVLCLGGPDLMWAMNEFARPGGAGLQHYTGIGFLPTAVLVTPLINLGATSFQGSAGDPKPTRGWATDPLMGGEACTQEALARTVNYPTVAASAQSSKNLIYNFDPQTVTVIGDIVSLRSLDPDGYSLCWAHVGTGTGGYAGLSIGGVGATAGVFAQPATAVAQTVPLTNTPAAVLLTSAQTPVAEVIQPSASVAFGASDGAVVGSNWAQTLTAQGPTIAARYHSDTDVLTLATAAATATASVVNGRIGSIPFGPGVMTPAWTTSDGAARLVMFLALGGVPRLTSQAQCPVPVGPTLTVRLIRRERTFAFPYNMDLMQFLNRFEVVVQNGVGLNGGNPSLPSPVGAVPVIFFQLSPDGGQTWGPQVQMGMGQMGQYQARTFLNRVGHGRNLVGLIVCSDPVPAFIMNGLADLVTGIA